MTLIYSYTYLAIKCIIIISYVLDFCLFSSSHGNHWYLVPRKPLKEFIVALLYLSFNYLLLSIHIC